MELLLPGEVVVIKVLPVQSVLVATSVEKSGGGVVNVDAAAVVPEDDDKVPDSLC